MRRPLLPAIILIALAAVACGPEPLEFADWTIPVEEGTRVIEYRSPAAGRRSEVIEFERDLVLAEAFARPLYQPRSLAVDGEGTVFVLDAGNHRVVVFDSRGNPLREFGRQGQGPGELQRPDRIGIAGSKVLVNDGPSHRISVFATAGEHVADHLLDERFWAQDLMGFGGNLIAVNAQRTPIPTRRGMERYPVPWSVGIYSLAGQELTRLFELEDAVDGSFIAGDIVGLLPVIAAHPRAALSADGTSFVTAGDEYQVVAIAPSGRTRWALRADWPAEQLTEERRNEALEALRGSFREQLPDVRIDHLDWPDRLAAIENLEVDGRGNLWVFPYSYRPPNAAPSPDQGVLVDVYSSQGDRLFSGMTAIDSWDSALGDHVYRIETNPDTGERVVSRYRLVVPF